MDSRFKLLAQARNAGPAQARNAGLREASGRFVAFHDVDDLWHSEKLQRQVEFMEQSGLAWSFHDYRHLDDGRFTVGRAIRTPPALNRRRHYTSRTIACSAVMVDRERVGEFAFPHLNRRAPEDFLAWTGLLDRGLAGGGLNSDLLLLRLHPQSRSAGKGRAILGALDVYRADKGLTRFQCYAYWTTYLARAALKHYRCRPSTPMLQVWPNQSHLLQNRPA
jgi:teichuronic acid biosynthesis glycosyltransferase TuaG